MKLSICNLTFLSLVISIHAQTLPTTIVLKDIQGGTFTMGNNSLVGPADQLADEHTVTVSDYSMSEAEITNAQYVEFLNAAYADGLIQVVTGTGGPDKDKRLIQGTTSSGYNGKTLYSLDGIRVLKDHDNADNENPSNAFTGDVEPENPLNIAYIDFNSSTNQFYVKDPFDVNDFHWQDICNYQDYGTSQGVFVGDILNDFDDWDGGVGSFSDELEGWTESNPSAATNLPTQAEVSAWPVTFIRWWGARAFADYYGVSLPTEAQWEYAAKGGQDFQYSVHDGQDLADANYNSNHPTVATHHVRAAISGTANPFGLYNIGGNAWEWIADNFVTPYDTATVTDPLIEVQGSTLRSWRGGSWNYHVQTLETARRFSDEEDRGNDHFGFRIAAAYGAGGQTSTLPQIWENANAQEIDDSGWYITDIGILNIQSDSQWIYHVEWGWTYIEGESLESVWLWNSTNGWHWTSTNSYPYLFRQTIDGWVYWLIDENLNANAYNYVTELWETGL